jgi:hypothetical protein
MAGENVLINLGDISKTATVLIKKISDAIGGYYRPYQIKRVAKAEAEAEIIKAQAEIEITELQKRALVRFVAEEAQKQDNIERITQKALPLLEESSNPQNMENDWIANFFDKCRIISDEEMQSLWAKVLAGEANAAGTFSKRTVNFLGSLDKNDARLFTSLCGFGWLLLDFVPIIFDALDPIYISNGIGFETLTHLDNIGLVSFDHLAGFKLLKLPKVITAIYYNDPVTIEFRKDTDNELQVGKVLLTQTGQELAPICGSKPVEGFKTYVMERWMRQGVVLNPPLQQPK